MAQFAVRRFKPALTREGSAEIKIWRLWTTLFQVTLDRAGVGQRL
jgi:hypothetical protein